GRPADRADHVSAAARSGRLAKASGAGLGADPPGVANPQEPDLAVGLAAAPRVQPRRLQSESQTSAFLRIVFLEYLPYNMSQQTRLRDGCEGHFRGEGGKVMDRCNFLVTGLCIAALWGTVAPAQSIYGTLTGIVSDQSQAVVAKATVRLRDQQS